MIFLDQLTKEQINAPISMSLEKAIVLVGVQGRGKTTLYNRMTNSQCETKLSGQSVTQKAFMRQSSFGRGFKVLDTPGFESSINKIQHIAGLLAAISEGPLNRIMVVLKLDRIALMVKEFKNVSPAFQRFTPIITLVVTYWDLSENIEEDKKIIETDFSKIGINSILFSSKHDPGLKICQEIDQILENSPPENVILSESECLLNFDFIPDNNGRIDELQNLSGSLQVQFHKISQEILKFLNGYPKDQQNQLLASIDVKDQQSCSVNLMNQLTEFAKDAAESIVKQFESQNINIIDDLAQGNQQMAYLIHFDLKKKLFKDLQSLQQRAQEKLINYKHHCYNNLRKCISCGLVWLKVAGCIGTTACGGIPVKDKLIKFEKPPVEFTIKYENKQLIVERNQNYLTKKQEFIIENKKNLPQKAISNKRKIEWVGVEQFEFGEYGCGRIQEWNQMDPLTPQEQQELYSNGMMDYFMKQEREIQKAKEVRSEVFRESLIKEVLKQKENLKQNQDAKKQQK